MQEKNTLKKSNTWKGRFLHLNLNFLLENAIFTFINLYYEYWNLFTNFLDVEHNLLF